MAPVDVDAHDRIERLEKGQLDLRESMHSIRNSLQVMQRDSDHLGKKFDTFCEKQEQMAEDRRREIRGRTITPFQFIALAVAVLGGAATIMGGLVWLIQSFTGQNTASVITLASQTADRFNVFQESIRSIREGDLKTGENVGDVRVALGRAQDRLAITEKRWEDWDRHDWAGVNATQSAEIVANRARIERLERRFDDGDRRALDMARSRPPS